MRKHSTRRETFFIRMWYQNQIAFYSHVPWSTSSFRNEMNPRFSRVIVFCIFWNQEVCFDYFLFSIYSFLHKQSIREGVSNLVEKLQTKSNPSYQSIFLAILSYGKMLLWKFFAKRWANFSLQSGECLAVAKWKQGRTEERQNRDSVHFPCPSAAALRSAFWQTLWSQVY